MMRFERDSAAERRAWRIIRDEVAHGYVPFRIEPVETDLQEPLAPHAAAVIMFSQEH